MFGDDTLHESTLYHHGQRNDHELTMRIVNSKAKGKKRLCLLHITTRETINDNFVKRERTLPVTDHEDKWCC